MCNVWQWDKWQAGMGIVDFTNPAACRWYADQLRALVKMGVDCFKTDFGERIPTDVVYFDGSDPQRMHNFYPYLYNKTVFEMLEAEMGTGNAVLFARSATTGGQKFANKTPIVLTDDDTSKISNNAPKGSVGAIGDYAVVFETVDGSGSFVAGKEQARTYHPDETHGPTAIKAIITPCIYSYPYGCDSQTGTATISSIIV